VFSVVKNASLIWLVGQNRVKDSFSNLNYKFTYLQVRLIVSNSQMCIWHWFKEPTWPFDLVIGKIIHNLFKRLL